jgi:hypothetical protein
MRIFQRSAGQRNGFALVVTLSLMILLTILAVGLLTLSSVSLRSSAQGEAMATARANARLALMLALGDLQKSAGPDKAITATSGILAAAPGKPNLTGVWKSWDFDPRSPGDYAAEKTTRFQRWLVSNPDPAAVESQNFGASNWAGTTIELVGAGSLGASVPDTAKVRAGRVPILRNGKVQGAYAWQVADESVKARINLYRDPAQNTTLAKKRALLAGQRPDPAVMKGADGNLLDCLPTDLTTTDFNDAKATVDKVLDLSQVELLGAAKGKIKQFRNDITPYSLGVLTDVRRGGLKQDLSSVFEMTTSATSTPVLPAEFTGKHLYESTHGITGASDPYWSLLASYYSVFRGLVTPESNPTYSQRPVQDAVAVPTTYFAGPVIAKIETLFSFVTRDAHAGWLDTLMAVDPQMKYMGHLVYTPLVTLHNPYNVSIAFDNLEVVFRNLPVAFRFFVNNKPQSTGLVPLCEMYYAGAGEKSFALNIANYPTPTSTTPSGQIVMKPGQTLVCGPYLDPSDTFVDAYAKFFDFTNTLTGVTPGGGTVTIAAIPAKPGFYGRCMGFDIDWLTPPQFDAGTSTDNNMGVLGLRADDNIHMEYAVRQPSVAPNTSFEVTARITSQGRIKNYGGLNFYYKDGPTLQNLLPGTYQYPSVGDLAAGTAYVPNNQALSDHAQAQTIAVFSAYARTTSGGVFDNNTRSASPGAALRDGRLAGKPYQFHNPTSPLVAMDLSKTKPSGYPYELNFQPFTALGQVEDYFGLDITNRTFALTGNTRARGIKSGSYLEVPSGPLQTIADFRRSNVVASSYQPGFVQPVANSWVHPMMSTDKVRQPDETGTYDLLDHSVLANHALYDRFYFSTFATNGTLTPDKVFDNFMNGAPGTALLSQCFQPYLPAGKTAAMAKSELFAGGTKPVATAYQNAAQYQMVRGAFNVNSTSVQAWKAVLSSARKSEIAILWEKTAALQVPSVKAANTPVLPMSLVNGGLATAADVDVIASKVDDPMTNQWNGYRELGDAELETLARKIVEQVRARGPFLSMSEFVNRQLGADGDITECGALESALAAANTNGTVFANQVPISAGDLADTNLYNYKTPNAACGNPAAGAPGWITQGDLMRILEPAATVRSDTFVIRVYGEALDPAGKVTARAYAEAVVQRMPEYVDPADNPAVNVDTATSASQINKTFGRRINVVSFRWLTANEI